MRLAISTGGGDAPGLNAVIRAATLSAIARGWTVLEASRSHGIPHMSVCGGRARCSTCRVRVTAGLAACEPPGEDEARTLERVGAQPEVRLA